LIAAEPDRAYLGQKDAAQIAVLRRMVRDLDLPVELIVCPIVREPDGLAMSSRNRYLIPEERRQALTLNAALNHVETMIRAEKRALRLIEAAQSVLAREPAIHVDYITVVDWATLLPVETAEPGSLFAIAAWGGTTRLIDNFIVA